MPVSEKPMTPPARKAVLNDSVQPTVGEHAPTVQRALEKTATFMPMRPEIIDVIAPMPNEARLRLISRADAGWSRPRGTDAQAPSALRHEGRRALRGSHAKDEAAAMQPRSQLQEG